MSKPLGNLRFHIALIFLALIFISSSSHSKERPPLAFESQSTCRQNDTSLKLIYLGNTTFIFCQGNSALFIDGFVSRPSLLEVRRKFDLVKHKEIVKDVYSSLGFEKSNVAEKDITIVPLHSHYDHAMDVPLIVKHLGAKLVGSKSSVNLVKSFIVQDNQTNRLITSSPCKGDKVYCVGDLQFVLQKAEHAIPLLD